MPLPSPVPFSSLYERLVANTHTPESPTGCWTWKGRIVNGYPRFNVRCEGKHLQLRAHRAMLCLLECEGETELFYSLYQTYSVAEFEAEHLCDDNPACINPDHLEWLTKEEHLQRTKEQKRACWRHYRCQGE